MLLRPTRCVSNFIPCSSDKLLFVFSDGTAQDYTIEAILNWHDEMLHADDWFDDIRLVKSQLDYFVHLNGVLRQERQSKSVCSFLL